MIVSHVLKDIQNHLGVKFEYKLLTFELQPLNPTFLMYVNSISLSLMEVKVVKEAPFWIQKEFNQYFVKIEVF